MSEDRHYWPTDARMSELRAEGDIPVSALAALCAATIMAGAICYVTVRASVNACAQILKALSENPADTAPLTLLFQLLGKIVVMPTVCIAGVVVILGLAQTRFYIGPAALRLDLTRAFPKLSALNPLRFLVRAAGAALVTSGLLLGGLLVGGWGVRTLLPALAAELGRLPFWLVQVVHRVAIVAGVVLLVLGAVGVAGARIRFKMRHRMTKSEMEQEGAQ